MDQEMTGWRLVGALVRDRRRFLRLRQEDLRARGGPSSATVRKVEGGAGSAISDRTWSEIEDALGWPRRTIRRILGIHTEGWWADQGLREDFARELIEADGASPGPHATPERVVASAADLTDEELLAELTYRMRRYSAERNGRGHRPAPIGDDVVGVEDAVEGLTLPPAGATDPGASRGPGQPRPPS